VDSTGSARITDFGLSAIASDLGSAASATDSHAVRWAAPEVLDMGRPVGMASDIYSFAMVVIEIFTGRAPFHDIIPITVAVDVVSGKRPERPMHPALPDHLWDLTERCWSHDPRQRPEISEIVLRLRNAPAPQYDGSGNLESVQQELSSGYHRRPLRPIPASSKPRRRWRFGRFSLAHVSKKGSTHAGLNEVEKSMNMRHKFSSASNIPRREEGWFHKYKPHLLHSRCDRSNGKQAVGAVPTGSATSSASSHAASFKRFLVGCREIVVGKILRPLKIFSVP